MAGKRGRDEATNEGSKLCPLLGSLRSFVNYLWSMVSESATAKVKAYCSANAVYVNGTTAGRRTENVAIKLTVSLSAQDTARGLRAAKKAKDRACNKAVNRAIDEVLERYSRGQLLVRLCQEARKKFGAGNRDFIRVDLKSINASSVGGSHLKRRTLSGSTACAAVHGAKLEVICRSYERQTNKLNQLDRLLECGRREATPSARLFESCKRNATDAEQRYRRFYADVQGCLRRLEKLER